MSDWRERRDALVAEYLDRSGGDRQKAADALSRDYRTFPEAVSAYLEARTVLLEEADLCPF